MHTNSLFTLQCTAQLSWQRHQNKVYRTQEHSCLSHLCFWVLLSKWCSLLSAFLNSTHITPDKIANINNQPVVDCRQQVIFEFNVRGLWFVAARWLNFKRSWCALHSALIHYTLFSVEFEHYEVYCPAVLPDVLRISRIKNLKLSHRWTKNFF